MSLQAVLPKDPPVQSPGVSGVGANANSVNMRKSPNFNPTLVGKL